MYLLSVTNLQREIAICNEQFRDNSFIGFYDNVFASKNFELLNEEMNNNMENHIPENIAVKS